MASIDTVKQENSSNAPSAQHQSVSCSREPVNPDVLVLPKTVDDKALSDTNISARDIKITKPRSGKQTTTPIADGISEAVKTGAIPIVPGVIKIKNGNQHETELDPLASYSDAALYWYHFGFQIIPITPGSKKTAVKWDAWLDDLTPQKIGKYWERHPDHEVGLIVGDHFIVFDADGPMSIASLHQIEEASDLSPALTIKTAKGEHHYFKRPSNVYAKSDSHSTENHPERIDAKTGRAMVVLPPSTGKTLEINEIGHANELTEASQQFIDAVFRHNGRAEPRSPVKRPDIQLAAKDSDVELDNIKALLDHISPDGGYDDWLNIGMAIYHEAGGGEPGLHLFDEWSSKGEDYPGWEQIQTKWNSFADYTGTPLTIATVKKMVVDNGHDWMDILSKLEPDFTVCKTEVIYPDNAKGMAESSPSESAGTLDELATVQKQYSLVNIDGRIWVLDEYRLNVQSKLGMAQKVTFSTRSDGGLLVNRAVRLIFPQADASKTVKDFFTSPKTTCYDGIEFNPAETTDNYLNVWVGPTAIPKAGQWNLISDFLLKVICNSDEKAYPYLLNFITHALQRPWEKPGILIICLGGQGTGKGTFGRILRSIWSATFLQVHDINTVTGSFNASLERSFIVFMDEALFVGDRRASDALKSLVTEPVIQINEKHQPARQTHSYHRFIVATNADHLKHTERDDRRDFVLRVSEDRKGDHAYWNALNHEIDHGGVEAMVHDLLAMDLSSFNVRNKPETQELLEQKLRSLDPIPRWWYDCLQAGVMQDEDDWPDFISTASAIEGIVEVSGGKIYRKPAASDVVQALLKLCPSATKKQSKVKYSGRQRGLELPSLEQARGEFEVYIGGKISW